MAWPSSRDGARGDPPWRAAELEEARHGVYRARAAELEQAPLRALARGGSRATPRRSAFAAPRPPARGIPPPPRRAAPPPAEEGLPDPPAPRPRARAAGQRARLRCQDPVLRPRCAVTGGVATAGPPSSTCPPPHLLPPCVELQLREDGAGAAAAAAAHALPCWPRRRGRRCWPRRARPPLLAMRRASAVRPELGLPESCPLPGGVGAPLRGGRAGSWRSRGRGSGTPSWTDPRGPRRRWPDPREARRLLPSGHGGSAAAAPPQAMEVRRRLLEQRSGGASLSPFLLRRGGPLSLRSSSLPAASVRRSTARHEPPACHAPPPPCRAAPRLCLQPVPRLRLRPAHIGQGEPRVK